MEKPSRLFLRQVSRLFSNKEDSTAFTEASLNPPDLPTALVWLKEIPENIPFASEKILFPPFDFATKTNDTPGKTKLHDEGYFYCMDYSSLFAAGIFFGVLGGATHILDMCASPGGKGIVASRFFSPETIYFNEVIGKRHGALYSNLKRCAIPNSRVTRQDSKIWAQQNPEEFDLVIVDAPCSGQSLPVKGIEAKGCFHPQIIKMNSNRQKRILANSGKISSRYLAYMTCTYAEEENESVVAWFLKKFPEYETVAVKGYESYQSHLADFFCYRLWPQSQLGAGSFTCLLRKKS